MAAAVVIGVGCVLVVAFVSAAVILWGHLRVHVGADSEDEEDDVEMEGGLRTVEETAALIDNADESHPQSASEGSFLMTIANVFGRKHKKKKKLMQCRRNGAKKIHKPYFYPLLDETAQWFAEWESKKKLDLPATTEDAIENALDTHCRIDKLNDVYSVQTSTSYPRDLLDMPFRPSSHYSVVPVTTI